MKIIIKEFETNDVYEGTYEYGRPSFTSCKKLGKVYTSMSEVKWVMSMIESDCLRRICYQVLKPEQYRLYGKKCIY